MKKCNKCGHTSDDNAKFCIDCGANFQENNKVSENRCVKCDALQRDDAKFCHVCGTEFITEEQSQKVMSASWDDYKVSKKRNKRIPGTIYPILMIPALVAFIFIITKNDTEPQHNQNVSQQQQQKPSMAQMQRHMAEIDSLKKVLEVNAEDTTALHKLGMYYEIAGRFKQSRDYFQRYSKLVPENNDVLMRIANTYFSEKNYIASMQEIEKVLKRSPDHLVAMYNYGYLLSLTGNQAGAKAQWEKVIALDKSGEMAESARKAIEFLKTQQ